MGKKDVHRRDLAALLDGWLQDRDPGLIFDYIVSNSNLPGPRGNLELAEAFADLVRDRVGRDAEAVWWLVSEMAAISPDSAPVNDPRELLPFCGAVGIGSAGSVLPTHYDRALVRLKELASDPRWRMREAVCIGLQNLMAKRARETFGELERWITQGKWLEMRAVAAAVAEPSTLREKELASWALQLHRQIIDRVGEAVDRKLEGFRILRKALGYSLSVVVCAVPEEGFPYLCDLVATGDPDVIWIVRQNLKKNRLAKNHPAEVEAIARIITT